MEQPLLQDEDVACEDGPLISRRRWIYPALFGSACFGFSLSSLNSCFPSLVGDLHWCEDGATICDKANANASTIHGILFIGAALGSLSAGSLAEKGRRQVILQADLLYIIGSILTAFATIGHLIVVGRLIIGFANGLIAVITPMYIAEMSDVESRGSAGVLHQMTIGSAVFLGIAAGIYEFPHNWRYIQLVVAMLAATQLAFFIFYCNKETPTFLIYSGKESEAAKVLAKFVPSSEVKSNIQSLKNAMSAKGKKKPEENKGRFIILRAWATPYYRFAISLGITLACFQQLGGMNVVNTRSASLFAEVGFTTREATLASMTIAFLGIISSIVAIPFIDTLGRRPLSIIGYAGQTCSFGILMVNNWVDGPPLLNVVGMAAYRCFYSGCTGPILWVYLSEIYPVDIRSHAMGFAVMLHHVSGASVVYGSDFASPSVLFTVLTAINACGWLIAVLFIVETAGMDLDLERSRLYPHRKTGTTADGKSLLPSQITRSFVEAPTYSPPKSSIMKRMFSDVQTPPMAQEFAKDVRFLQMMTREFGEDQAAGSIEESKLAGVDWNEVRRRSSRLGMKVSTGINGSTEPSLGSQSQLDFPQITLFRGFSFKPETINEEESAQNSLNTSRQSYSLNSSRQCELTFGKWKRKIFDVCNWKYSNAEPLVEWISSPTAEADICPVEFPRIPSSKDG